MEKTDCYDLVVVGGGINGTGIAADAAGRGLKVLLLEAKDLASSTSSASSKLIHGGLRYLEHYEFRLVKEALAERETLLKLAPHLIEPMRFRLPHRPHLRPAWMIRIGLFLYDHLAKRETLPGSKLIRHLANDPLKSHIKKSFEYSDGWVDDARLVLGNAKLAEQHGAKVLTYSPCTMAKKEQGNWVVEYADSVNQTTHTVHTKALVNAAGPWVQEFFHDQIKQNAPRNIRLVKGSHIVVPKLHNEDHAYILQNEDKRIVFVIPYLDKFSLVGTTDVDYQGDPRKVGIDAAETEYLCQVVNDHFRNQITPEDVVWDYSGVRPLCDDESSDAQAVTRDYTIEIEDEGGKTPLLSVFGGKLTTYRKLAEAAMEQLVPYFPQAKSPWTKTALIPGGDINGNADAFYNRLQQQHPYLPVNLCRRYAKCYGSSSLDLLASVKSFSDLGKEIAPELYQVELDYLIEHEFAKKGEDALFRRSKLGITYTQTERADVDAYVRNKAGWLS